MKTWMLAGACYTVVNWFHFLYLMPNNILYAVHTACFQASQDSSQHIKCWKPYAVTYGLALLKTGVMMPKTCWTNGLLINHNLLHLVGLTRHFIFYNSLLTSEEVFSWIRLALECPKCIIIIMMMMKMMMMVIMIIIIIIIIKQSDPVTGPVWPTGWVEV